jgi:hypothetical protein
MRIFARERQRHANLLLPPPVNFVLALRDACAGLNNRLPFSRDLNLKIGFVLILRKPYREGHQIKLSFLRGGGICFPLKEKLALRDAMIVYLSSFFLNAGPAEGTELRNKKLPLSPPVP